MTTDEQMDARLRRAGEAWRITTSATTEFDSVEPSTLTPPAPATTRRHRMGLLASAAVVAAALVAGGAVLVANITGTDDRGPSATGAAPLEGTVWRLIGYGNEQQPNSFATMYISNDGQLITDDSCNLTTAHVDVSDGQIFPTDFGGGSYNCVDAGGELTFPVDFFASFPHYQLGSNELTLTGAGKTMHLVAAPLLPVPTADRPTVTGATWKLVKVTGPDGAEHPVSGAATFRIDSGQLRASDSCNTLGGSAVVTGNEIDTKNLAVTEIACPQDVMATAQVVDAVFANSPRSQLLGTKLTIGLTGAGTLEYRWVPSDSLTTDPADLTDRTWQLASVAGDPVGDRIELRVGSDGTVAGYDGCRKIEASAEVAAGTLTITGIPPAGFGPGCDGNLATTVDSLLTQRSALWRLADGDLVINGPGAQALALVFHPADGSQPTASPLTGIHWTLTTIEAGTGPDATAHTPIPGQSLAVKGTEISGQTPCNFFSGSVNMGPGTLDISGLGSTLAGCAEDPEVFDVLRGQVTWQVDGDQLTITKDGVGALVYTKGGPPGPPLVGTHWVLSSMSTEGPNSGSGTASPDSGVVLTIAGKDSYELVTGCHTYEGTATISDSTVTFADQRDLGGDDCLNRFAQELVHFLDGTADWSSSHGELTLTKGNTTATFTS